MINLPDSDQLQKLHRATVRILEKTGLDMELPEALRVFKAHGAEVDGARVRIPESLLDKALEVAPRSFSLAGRDPARSVYIGPGQQHPCVEPGHGAVFVIQGDGKRRLGNMADLNDFHRLAHASELCSLNAGLILEPADLVAKNRLLYVFLDLLKTTDKPFRALLARPGLVRGMADMFDLAAGKKGLWRERPHCYVNINPLSPLAYAPLPLQNLMAYAEMNQGVAIVAGAGSGISAPMSLTGALLQQNAEILAGVVLAQLVRPGAPCFYGPSSIRPDMQSAHFVASAPESNLLTAAGARLAELYGLPVCAMGAVSDAKELDYQAGMESMQNLHGLLPGCNLVTQGFGVMDSLMSVSREKFVLDMEAASRVWRIAEGMEEIDIEGAVREIEAVGPRGSYLHGSEARSQCRASWRPDISSWETNAKWQKRGRPSRLTLAGFRAEDMLAGAPQSLLSPEVEAELEQLLKHDFAD